MARRPSEVSKDREEGNLKNIRDQTNAIQSELDGLSAEYDELCDTWKLIDSKAQITATAAGIFLGGIFAVQRTPNFALPSIDKWLLALALALLVLSIICALKSLELRNIVFPPRGTISAEMFRDLRETREFKNVGSEMAERLRRYKLSQAQIWERVNLATLTAINSKGTWTLAAQFLFALGASTFAGLSLYEIFRETPLPSGLGDI
jgi:hypothetical protein